MLLLWLEAGLLLLHLLTTLAEGAVLHFMLRRHR